VNKIAETAAPAAAVFLSRNFFKKNLKKVEKTFKKVLTKERGCGIISSVGRGNREPTT